MPGNRNELRRYLDWAKERWVVGQDPRDFWAFVKHIHNTGGDVSRIGDYGWPNSITIKEPVYLPNA